MGVWTRKFRLTGGVLALPVFWTIMQHSWKVKFRAIEESQVKIVSFTKPNDMIQWYRENLGEVDHPLFLSEYGLSGSEYTGLDFIEMLGIASEAILVANRWGDQAVRQRCEKFNVKILPKSIHVLIEFGEAYAD